MNLLDSASLVVTPNGYKASKLYSIVPSDGSGDMTFARTGDTATRVNSSGYIETVLANKPRLDYTGGGCPKLLLEPQRTNIVNYSNTFNSSYWQNISNATPNSIISPDGSNNGYLLTGIMSGFVSVTNALTYTASLFVKKTNYATITLRIDATANNSCQFNLDTLTAGTNGSIESYGNNWYRLKFTLTANNTATGVFYIIPTTSIYAYGAQLEAGSYATSYIPTTTASVTRNADSCYKTGITSLIGQTEGTLYVNAEINNGTSAGLFGIRNTGLNFIYIFNSPGKIYCNIYNASSAQASLSFDVSTSGIYKIAAAYKANDFVLYVNGVQRAVDTSGSVPTCNEFRFDDSSLGLDAGAKILNASIWKTRLSNADLASLTS